MGTERLTKKLKAQLSEKLKTWVLVKLKIQLPAKQSHLSQKVLQQRSFGVVLYQSFRRASFGEKHTMNFFILKTRTRDLWLKEKQLHPLHTTLGAHLGRSLGADLYQSFHRVPFGRKHMKDFFHTEDSNSRPLIKGETTPSTAHYVHLSLIWGPKVGYRGKVLLSFEDNVLAKVGVRFDKPFPYGIDLGGLCDDSHGYFCRVSELCLEVTDMDDLDKLLAKKLFEVVFNESRISPFILFMKDAEKLMAGNSESYSTFKSQLEKPPDDVAIIGSHAHTDNHKEKVVFNESRNSLFILFLKDAEELMAGNSESYSTFKKSA